MSDTKMSDLLALPLVRTTGGVMPFLKDGNGEVMFVGDGYHIDAVIEAVNTHDAMQDRIMELENIIRSRPKHCEHISEDGEFYNVDDYINMVSAWAFIARKALNSNKADEVK